MFNKLKSTINKSRCFILGSAPSLIEEDLSLLKNENIFIVNRGYKALDHGLTHYDFYVCIDKRVYEKNQKEIQENTKFPRFYNHTFLDSEKYWKGSKEKFIPIFKHENKNSILYKSLVLNIMPTNYYDGWGNSSTVVLDTAMIAFFLGYKEIYLLGVDLSYKNNTETHFYGKDYDEENPLFEKENRPVVFRSNTLNFAINNINNFFKTFGVKMVNLSKGYHQNHHKEKLFLTGRLKDLF